MKTIFDGEMDQRVERKTVNQYANRLTGGIALIFLGLAIFLSNWLSFELYLVLLIGAALLAWGVFSRSARLTLSGGVLCGIGSGILALQGPWHLELTDQGRSAVFLLCFALGWLLVTVLTSLADFKTLWWPLIPGGIMAVAGIVLLTATHWFLQFVIFIWPVILILVGLYLVLLWNRSN
jgi:hypothetical protein